MTEQMTEPTLRVDKWLWYARFFKSRSLAAKHVLDGKIRLNRHRILKPSAPLKVGDVLTFVLRHKVIVVEIKALGNRRGPAAEARTLFSDLTDAKLPSHVELGSKSMSVYEGEKLDPLAPTS